MARNRALIGAPSCSATGGAGLARACVAALVGLALTSGCGDVAAPRHTPPDARLAIIDAIHKGPGGEEGHPQFYWRDPIVEDPADIPGVFDATLLPRLRVEIYLADEFGAPVGPPIETFTNTADAPNKRLRVDANASSYGALWNTAHTGAAAGSLYEIQVYRDDELLGTADIIFVEHARDRIDSPNFVYWVAGRLLPVNFTVQEDASGRLTRQAAIERVREELVDALAREGFVVGLAMQEPIPAGTQIHQVSASLGNPLIMTADDEAFFVFIDLAPRQKYGHDVLYALVDTRTGAVTVGPATGVPSIGGVPLYLTLEERLSNLDRFEPESVDQPAASVAATRAAATHFVKASAPMWGPAPRTGADAANDHTEPCRKVAVTIGAGKDNYIKNDAMEFARVLRSHGFEVDEFDSATDDAVTVLAGVQNAAAGLGPCDKFLLYISVHIGQDKSEPDNINGVDYGAGEATATDLRFGELNRILNNVTAGHINVVLDACFSEAWIRSMRTSLALQPGVTLNVFTSSAADKTSEGPGGWDRIANFFEIGTPTSRYTEELLEQLDGANLDTDGDGHVSVPEFEDAFRRAHDAVAGSLSQMPQSATFTGPAVNQPPQATITEPQDGASFDSGQPIGFSGSATDAEDGTLAGGSLVWMSDRDGQIGTGNSFTRNDLSAGTHVITLTGTDSQGATGTHQVTITVIDPPKIELEQGKKVGFGLQTTMQGELAQAAPAGGAAVTLTSGNSNLLLSDDAATVGTGSLTIGVPGGETQFQFVVQALEGFTGGIQLDATSPGYAGGTATVDIVQSALRVSNLPPTTSINLFFDVELGIPNDDGSDLLHLQRVRASGTPVTATVTSSDPTVAELSNGTTGGSVSFDFLPLQETYQIELRPLKLGSTTISAAAPGVLSTAAAQQSVQVSIDTEITLPDLHVGAGLMTSQLIATLGSPAPPGGVTVTFTSTNANALELAADPVSPGAATLEVLVPEGATQVPFVAHGIGTGSAIVAASAPGYSPATRGAAVVDPTLQIIGLPALGDPNERFPFQVVTGIPNGADFGTEQSIRFGASPLGVDLFSTNPTAGQLFTQAGLGQTGSVVIQPGQSRSPLFVSLGGVDLLMGGASASGQSTTIMTSAGGFATVNQSQHTITVR